jgi:hypothetical protein
MIIIESLYIYIKNRYPHETYAFKDFADPSTVLEVVFSLSFSFSLSFPFSSP